jgi:ferredoxin
MGRSKKAKSGGSAPGEVSRSSSSGTLLLPLGPLVQPSLLPKYAQHRRPSERRLRRTGTRAHQPVLRSFDPPSGSVYAASAGWDQRCDACQEYCPARSPRIAKVIYRERRRVELSQLIRLCEGCRQAARKLPVDAYVPKRRLKLFLRYIDNLATVPAQLTEEQWEQWAMFANAN